MKSTILSEKDSRLLGEAILAYGRILDIRQLLVIFMKEYTTSSAYKRIILLSNAGWLKRIKRGLYLVIDSLTARSQIDISLMIIANTLVKDSYVSLSYALNYYNMFDQYARTVASVSSKEQKKYAVDDFTFTFSKIRKGMCFGFSQKMENGKFIRIADAEKALIDYLYLDKSFGSASLVFEKMREHNQKLDLTKLQEYALRSTITVQRELGFMLDELGFDSGILYESVKNNRGASHFTEESRIFNAKWRLYYDDRIIG